MGRGKGVKLRTERTRMRLEKSAVAWGLREGGRDAGRRASQSTGFDLRGENLWIQLVGHLHSHRKSRLRK